MITNRVVGFVLLLAIVIGLVFVVGGRASAAPYCGARPNYCVPSGVTTVVKGTPDTVYRIRFVATQNGKVIERYTAGPYFSDTKALRKERQLREHKDSVNISRFRIEALSPGTGWEPALSH